MCLPDFDPFFNLLTMALRNTGDLLDNWLDVSTIIIQVRLSSSLSTRLLNIHLTPLHSRKQKSIGFDFDDECESLSMSLTPANYSRQVFGNNRVATVGLTDGLYAVTDGIHIQYFNHYNSVESTISPNGWPIDIDIGFGVAAVTYFRNSADRDARGNPSTTMLGCRFVCTRLLVLRPLQFENVLSRAFLFYGHTKVRPLV